MILYDYELVSSYNYFLLCGGLIFVGFKILEQLEKSFNSEEKVKMYFCHFKILEIVQMTQLDHGEIMEVAAKVLNLAKMFDTIYPNFENLKKYNAFALDE
jgi:hypothetical protein